MANPSFPHSDLNPDHIRPGRHNLIAVLDWGLGHASRSLALAARLRRQGERISWATAGQALTMLRRECPEEICHELPAYGIRYPTANMGWNMLQQSPRILRAIRAEKRAIEEILQDHSIDRLISDSRFGCRSKKVPSVFLSHQLRPIVPLPVLWLYRSWLKPFAAYWVPDTMGVEGLSGRLSQSDDLWPVFYLGFLSRILTESTLISGSPHPSPKDSTTPEADRLTNSGGFGQISEAEEQIRIGVLLSGPEPQRTKLESELMNLLPHVPGQHYLVRGLPGEHREDSKKNVKVLPYADPEKIKWLLSTADLLICRSGYSTLMDLRSLGCKRVLLIPTPGQTEQIYLAKRAVDQGWVKKAAQGRLNLEVLLQALPSNA